MDLTLVLITFGLIFPVELPDKTFVATLVLATRYRPFPVWIGVGAAFGVQCVVAVTAGAAVSFLPDWIIHALSTAMFLLGAVLLLVSAPKADTAEREQEEQFAARAGDPRSGLRAAGASFLLLFAAEWGDLSQILTLNLVAKYGSPVSVFVGAWTALLVVSALAVVGGRMLLRYLRLSFLHYVSGAVCLLFAGIGLYQLATG